MTGITDGLGGIMGGWCQVWDQETGTTCLASKGWDLKFEIWWLGTGVWDPMSWATAHWDSNYRRKNFAKIICQTLVSHEKDKSFAQTKNLFAGSLNLTISCFPEPQQV